ncbi:MAG TPA: hypothetical protein VK961_22410 [Chthoniobacter sp.]|nr:hypothetical protein [Chthoniobacter sp.]
MQRTLLTLLFIVSVCILSPITSRAAGGDDAAIAEAGNTFFKKYLSSKDQFAYLLKSPLVTPAAKSAFQVIKKKADKDGGLDYDPALKGQDHADSYTVAKIHVQGTTASASAEAKGWPAIPVRFVHGKDGWQIDGVGEINIPSKH